MGFSWFTSFSGTKERRLVAHIAYHFTLPVSHCSGGGGGGGGGECVGGAIGSAKDGERPREG